MAVTKLGRRIYFELETGNVIRDNGEMQGAVVETTIEQDIEMFKALNERLRESFDYIQLDFGQYDNEFSTATGYRVNPTTKEIEFIYGENTEQLNGFKDMKINNLKRLCEQAIEYGFVSKVNSHTYRTNRDDQLNMIGQKDELMDDTTITTVKWKTEDVGYINHTREEWLDIYFEALNHKRTQLFKYDQLKQQVSACTTKEEIDAINW